MVERIPQKEVDYEPLCPYCETELREVHYRRMQTLRLYEYLYICPHCRKVLGVGTAAD